MSDTKIRPCSARISIRRSRSKFCAKASSFFCNPLASSFWATTRMCFTGRYIQWRICLGRTDTYLSNFRAKSECNLLLLPSYWEIHWWCRAVRLIAGLPWACWVAQLGQSYSLQGFSLLHEILLEFQSAGSSISHNISGERSNFGPLDRQFQHKWTVLML